MKQHRLAPIGLVVAVFILMAGLVVNAGAQGTPETGGSPEDVSHPAHIHTGTCDALGDVVFPLNNVAVPGSAAAVVADIASPVAEGGATPVASPIAEVGEVNEESTTVVEVALDDIISGGHAINVHESVENVQNYIACGDVTGSPAGGQLRVALNELNDSGYMGDALLQDNGDGTTTVSIVLIRGGSAGTPAATPVQGSSEGSVAVEIKDLAFGQASVTIAAGGSVTWTNMDTVPHTATARDRTVLQSGTLQQGDSFTQTFTTPGTYEYFCEFHADMKGTIIVE